MGASLENGMVRDISAIVFIILLILSFVLLLASDDDEPDVALGIINLTNWILRRG
jgi:hypothetical protein